MNYKGKMIRIVKTIATIAAIAVNSCSLAEAAASSTKGVNELNTHQLRRRQQKQHNSNNNDQHGSVVHCRITLFHTSYFSKDNSSAIDHEHETSCIPILNWEETDDLFPVILPDEFMATNHEAIRSGTLMISISNSTVTEHGIETSETSTFSVLENEASKHYRELQARSFAWKPVMTVAIVRISTLDASPTSSLSTLKTTHFGGDINFPKQYEACSFGKLKWKLAPNGLIDVKVNELMSSFGGQYTSLVSAAQQTMKDTMNIASAAELADKVIMCLPPGTGTWAGSAGVKHWRVHLNNDWCRSFSGTMHELGHTMGLLHAQADHILYNDRTGYMGSGYTDATSPKKCFNGYNSYLFGWYATRHLNLNSINLKKGSARLVNLATFVDFPKTTIGEPVIVNIADKYYLQYNKAKGFNMETEQQPNMVTVTQPIPDGTDRLAGLAPGTGTNKFEVSNFLGLGKLIIQVCSVRKSQANKADAMIVSIGIDKSLCVSTTPQKKSANIFMNSYQNTKP